METDRLKYFCAIIDCGSLSKASSLLGISHSGLSKSMASLEQELGLKLFIPSGRGLSVTNEGLALYDRASQIVALADGLSSKPESAFKANRIRIGISEAMSYFFLGGLSRAFDAKLLIEHLEVGESELAVSKGQLDFGFSLAPRPLAGIDFLKVCKIVFAAVVRDDLARACVETEMPYAVPSSELPKNILEMTRRDGAAEEIGGGVFFHVSHFLSAIELVRTGQAASFMPAVAVQKFNRIFSTESRFIFVPGSNGSRTVRQLYLIKKSNFPESAAMKKACRVMRAEFKLDE